MSDNNIALDQKTDQQVTVNENNSPGQFQDVTMDESYALGYRSPSTGLQHAGSTPPGQGRSVREIEEQMASLRKENFNLKLRIYFLEEKIPGYNSLNSDENESLLKQYVDLKVDVEVLRTELQEKQSLLCEAAKAMQLMEEQQKHSEEKHKEIIDELNEKIHFMEMENKDLEGSMDQKPMNEITERFDFLEDINALQKVSELEASLKQFEYQVEELTNSVNKKNDKIKELEEKEKQLLYQNAELQEQFDIKTKELVHTERNFNNFQEKLVQENKNNEKAMKKEKEAFQNDIDKLNSALKSERENLDWLVKRVLTQQNFLNEVQSVILEKRSDTTKMTRVLKQYNNEVKTLRGEQSNLHKEIQNLAKIIVKLRDNIERRESESQKMINHCNFLVTKSVEIFLGDDENSDHPAIHHKNRNSYKHRIGMDRKNRGSFFFLQPLQVDDNKMKCVEVNKSNTTISSNLHKRTNYACNSFRDPRLSKNEFKSFHNSFYSSHCQDSEKTDENICDGDTFPALPAPVLCPVQSHNNDVFELHFKKRARGNLISIGDQSLKLEASTTSSHLETYRSCTSSPKELIGYSDGNVKCTKLREELLECKKQLADNMCELEQAAITIKEKTTSNTNACKLIHNLYLEKEQLDKQIQLLTTKDNIEEESGGTVIRAVSDATGSVAGIKMKLEKVIAEKNNEINKLKSDVKRNKKYLRTLINKELVQKTIEIGSLSQLFQRLNSEPLSPSFSVDENVEDLRDSFTDAEYTEYFERNNNLQKKLNNLIQRLFSLNIPASHALVNQLRLENSDAREEVEQAHEYRREACRVLTERLEELASFLESLLQHESVYMSLGADKKREIRKAIDSSLNLSKSMNTSLSTVGVMSVTDQSLPQLSNISGLLNASAEETKNCSERLFKKIEKENTDIIEALKKENNILKKELSKKRTSSTQRKDRISLPITLDNRNQQDRAGSEESESWSEPDRSVSLARIGLENSSALKCNQNSVRSKSSTTIASDVDNNNKQSQIAQLEKMISQYDNHLLKLQCDLVEADNRLKEKINENNKINQELVECKLLKQNFETELESYKSKVNEYNQILINQENLNKILDEKNTIIREMQDKHNELMAETKCNNMKLEKLINDNVHLKDTATNNLEKIVEHERIKKEITDELKDVHKQLHEAENTIDYLRENEAETNKHLIEKEKSLRKLEKYLDDSNLLASKMVVERTKFLQEQKKVEEQLQEVTAKLKACDQERIKLHERVRDLQDINDNLQSKLLKKHKQLSKQSGKESDASQSGYTSEELPVHRAQDTNQRFNSSSPDLGIESDAGRASSEEVTGLQNRLLKSIENFCGDVNVMEEDKLNLYGTANDETQDATAKKTAAPKHDCTKVDQEILELRRKLAHSQKTLQKTMLNIKSYNQLKEKAERNIQRNIRRELVTTNNVLETVRNKLESEAK